MRRPGLTRSIALLCALAVAASIAFVSLLAWLTTRSVLRSQVDLALDLPADRTAVAPPAVIDGRPLTDQLEQLCRVTDDVLGAVTTSPLAIQLVRSDGTTCGPRGTDLVPVGVEDEAAARGGAEVRRDAETLGGTHVRVLTRAVGGGYAIMLVRDLSEIDTTLRRLAFVLAGATVLGGGLALTAGYAVARTALRPVDRLSRAAEHVSRTEDLHIRIPVSGEDEVARLGHAFNAMTASLEHSRDRQVRLVADAGHELRTPLTSLRTNIELLQRSEAMGRPLPPERRAEILSSVVAQLTELAHLTDELTELARSTTPSVVEPVRLDEVVRAAAGRVELRAQHDVVVEVEPWALVGDGGRLERAVVNLADNAVKFGPPGSTVRIVLRAVDDGHAELTVDDEGPGVRPGDRTAVFERFWRADDARSRPGSGLGLAIVAEAVEGHGGTVRVDDAPGGGARFTVCLPGHRP